MEKFRTMSKEQIENNTVAQYRDTAEAVYNYLFSLPEPLARYMFKQIILEAYDIASCYPVDEVIPQLAFAVSNYYNMAASDKAKAHLANYLGVDFYTFEQIITNEEKLEKTLLASKRESLPPADNLVKAFKCFTYSQMLCNFSGFEIWERLDQIVESYKKEKQPSQPLDENCFYKLGYHTALFNNEEKQNDKLIFHWFCEGCILDIVFKCIWDNSNQQVAVAFYDNLMTACRSLELARICEKRFKVVKETRAGWPYVNFEREDSVKYINLPALGFLDKEVTDGYLMKCDNLYKDLLRGEFIKCELTMFMNIFTDMENVQPIVWLKDTCSLACFAMCVFNKAAIQKKYNNKQGSFLEHFVKCINIKSNVEGATLKCKKNKCAKKTNEQYEEYRQYEELFEKLLNDFD